MNIIFKWLRDYIDPSDLKIWPYRDYKHKINFYSSGYYFLLYDEYADPWPLRPSCPPPDQFEKARKLFQKSEVRKNLYDAFSKKFEDIYLMVQARADSPFLYHYEICFKNEPDYLRFKLSLPQIQTKMPKGVQNKFIAGADIGIFHGKYLNENDSFDFDH